MQVEKIKIFPAWDNSYLSWVDKDKFSVVKSAEEADIIMFTGGPDVDPTVYNEKKGSLTHSSMNRDNNDLALYSSNKDKFKIGICRGAQFLTVMSGGSLFQDVTGHAIAGLHKIDVEYPFLYLINDDLTQAANEELEITSTHHQMMNPYGLKDKEFTIIASADDLSAWYLDGNDEMDDMPYENDKFVEPEIVYYNRTDSLCIQGHPENIWKENPIIDFLNKLLSSQYAEYLKKNKVKTQTEKIISDLEK